MNKVSKLIGIIAIIAAIAFSLTTCDDFGKTVTFSLDKKENYSFTITVEGAKWKDFTYNAYEAGSLVEFSNRYTIWVVDEQNKEYWCGFYHAYPYANWKRISDTVVTATFVSGCTPTGRMEIEFAYPESIGFASSLSDLDQNATKDSHKREKKINSKT